MNGLDVNGLVWTSAMTKDLETAPVWAIDETERIAKKAKAARIETSAVKQFED
jgi:exosome complex RNA-binding protein Rrp4